MQEIVNQILEGNYISEIGSLEFSCARIELECKSGEQVTGSFTVYGDSNLYSKGFVISTDYRMECLTPEFSGNETEISYVFHGEALEEEEILKGAFRIISNQGEYSVPYTVSGVRSTLDSSLGPVKNMFHFTNLAKSDWQEALKLFYSKQFETLFAENEAEYLQVYRGLSAYPGQEQNMEEFLIRIGKKQGVEFLLEQQKISLEVQPTEGEYQPMEQELTIIRNGWGYTVLNVDCDGGFLFTEKTLITEDDFLGNYARLPIYFDRSQLRPGMNFGKVVFFNSYVNIEVEVRVKLGVGHDLNRVYLGRKKAMVSLMMQYEGFRTKKIGLVPWLKETGTLVENLIALDETDPAARLFKAQLLITQDRINEANWLLDHAKDLMEAQGGASDELWAYYLYLTTLVSRDEEQIRQVSAEVETMYKKAPYSWRIAWLLLYLSEEFTTLPKAKLQMMERQFGYGCRSFVMYIEALQVYNNNPAMLQKLGDFEQQVLYYGIRRDYFNPELAEKFLDLLERGKDYSPVLCKILERLYEKRQDSRIVREMCSLLVKGGKVGPEYLSWYEKGVESQLRINNLYESFMMSLDLDNRKGLPKAAVLYFSYQNNLDYERSAFLYEYVLDNKVLYADVYDKYLAKCKDFCLEQIKKERISRHLAKLYTRILSGDMISEQNAKQLCNLVFATRIKVDDYRIRKVYLYTKGSLLPREYALSGAEVWVPIYGNDTTLVFEDAFSNRFAQNVSYEMEKYMLPGKYVAELAKYDLDCPEFDLYLLREKADGDLLDEDLAQRAERLFDWEYTAPELKKNLYMRLVKQCFDMGYEEKLLQLLDRAEEHSLTLEDRTGLIKYLVLSGGYEQAFRWVQQYGPYFPDANTLARLIGYQMATNAGMEDPAMEAAVTYLFHRGKVTAAMVEYLGKYARGTTKELRDIWKEFRRNGLDCTGLEERILVQILFTGAYVGEKQEIFEDYQQAVPTSDVVEAYLVQSAYDYFVREKLTEPSVFRRIYENYKWNVPLQKVCKLAFLKYYAENSQEISREINEALNEFLREMMAEKIHFAFYRKLKGQSHLLGELEDKTIVEYRTRPGGTARIHYVVLEGDGEAREYLSENMRDVFGGVCCKEFVLFFGETLQYYIMEEYDGTQQLTESGNLQREDVDGQVSGSKYSMINDMVISKSLQDYDTLDESLETYFFKEYCGESLFVLK